MRGRISMKAYPGYDCRPPTTGLNRGGGSDPLTSEDHSWTSRWLGHVMQGWPPMRPPRGPHRRAYAVCATRSLDTVLPSGFLCCLCNKLAYAIRTLSLIRVHSAVLAVHRSPKRLHKTALHHQKQLLEPFWDACDAGACQLAWFRSNASNLAAHPVISPGPSFPSA